MKWNVRYKYISRKTGHVASAGGITVEADSAIEAESKALCELRTHPRVQGTEGYEIEVDA